MQVIDFPVRTQRMITVADVPDAETQFHAHEFLDVTVQPKPIYISPNEVYSMHALLSQHQDYLVRLVSHLLESCLTCSRLHLVKIH